MAQFQRQYKTGAEYNVEGKAKKKRRLKFVGTAQISGKEFLLFRPVRRAKKQT